MAALHRRFNEALAAAESYPGSTGRQLLQYNGFYNNGYNGNYWGGGRIAGIVVGVVCLVLAIFFCILATTIRRRRQARYQANNAYPAGTYPAAQPVPNQYPQTGGVPNQYPQAGTVPNQAYPQNNGGFNPAPYTAGTTYPSTATGTPVGEYNGVQMSALPHEKPGYQSNV